MKISQILGLGLLVVGFILIRKMRKNAVQHQIFNGIVFKPTAIFILQNASKKPTIDFNSNED